MLSSGAMFAVSYTRSSYYLPMMWIKLTHVNEKGLPIYTYECRIAFALNVTDDILKRIFLNENE